MGDESERDTERTVVQTYVPAYQRDQWDEHADQLGMNRSEFVKAMVQAGRSEFGASEPEESTQSEPGQEKSLESEVCEILEESGPLSWDELLSILTEDIESRLDTTLQDLQSSDRVRYSGRDGGYILEANS
ncbi:DUF5805 domain-containing protein [Halovenus marina]|uniref:DUF5805 domain-containing protein n=1 Tax=Halovenus marina TaxID=3396621 RepID=UPI003F57DA01